MVPNLLADGDKRADTNFTNRHELLEGFVHEFVAFVKFVSDRFEAELRRSRRGLPFPGGYGIVQPVSVTVTQLAEQLIVSYARLGGINHLDGKNLPSKTAIVSITVDLLRLLFPGFFDEKTIHSSELKVEMVSLVDSVLDRLQYAMYKSLEDERQAG